MGYNNISFSVEDRVANITFKRPERLNAFSEDMEDEIISAVRAADEDPGIRVLVIKGDGGKAFSSGHDIKDSAELPPRDIAQWRAKMKRDILLTYSVWDCSKPVIASIDGLCLAGGLEFALCCDIRYCSEPSRFGSVEVRFSHGSDTMIMPWVIGQRCRSLLYTGDIIDAQEALRIGLVDKVFPSDELHTGTMKLAHRMSRVALECLRFNKRAINHTFELMGLRTALEFGNETCAIMDAISSPEADTFDAIKRSQGLTPALKWLSAQFEPYQ